MALPEPRCSIPFHRQFGLVTILARIMRASHRRILMDLLTLPTSPFNEQHIIAYVKNWASKRPAMKVIQDPFGNLQIHLSRSAGGRASRPLGTAGGTPAPQMPAEESGPLVL